MSTVLLASYPLPYPTLTVRFLTQAWWTCYSSPPYTWRQRSDVILATGEPLSVILPNIRHRLDLEVIPAPNWKGFIPTWLGVSCHIGRVKLWLPSQEIPGHFHSFSLLALLPQQDVPDAPPFIQIGAQFLLEYQVQVVLTESRIRNDTDLRLATLRRSVERPRRFCEASLTSVFSNAGLSNEATTSDSRLEIP